MRVHKMNNGSLSCDILQASCTANCNTNGSTSFHLVEHLLIKMAV